MIDAASTDNSFAEFLRPVAAGVPPALISPAAFADMEAIVRFLPETLANNTFGFECRMGEELPRADFSVLATTSSGRDSLARLDVASTSSTSLMTDRIWKRVNDFAVQWAEPSSSLYRTVANVWLEFDLDGPTLEIPRPSVFLGLPPYDRDNTQDRAYEPNVDGYRTTVVTATRLLTGRDLPTRVLETLSDCFRALLQHEYVFQVGLMLARDAEAVRMCIRLDSAERAIEYLGQVGWPGSDGDLRGVLELTRSVDYTWLDIDVAETVHPKIGLECYFDRHKQPNREPRWGTFLDSLVRAGLCTPSKRDALLTYFGYVDENAQGVVWPQALRRASQLLDGRSLSTFVRTLHHVKIVYRHGEPLEAKAYLAANHHWHTPRRGSEVDPISLDHPVEQP